MNVRRSAVVGNFAVEHNLTVRYLNHRRLAGRPVWMRTV